MLRSARASQQRPARIHRWPVHTVLRPLVTPLNQPDHVPSPSSTRQEPCGTESKNNIILKSIVKSGGLESYSVFEQKSKENSFKEIYIYDSKQAWEDADEADNERVDLLMTKLSDLIKDKSTQYSTLFEV